MAKPLINDVSDTALWVAVYRARETKRKDALFQDPLAEVLAGTRGNEIADNMKLSQYTEWSVVIRTCVIDSFIEDLIKSEKIDTVINLGCGLDTRPYRMNLPASFRWIEVDFPHMIQLKEEKLSAYTPKCKLERVGLDLANIEARAKLFARLGGETAKALILTEGVILYLTEEQVASLAESLKSIPSFKYWIVDYYSKFVMKRMTSARLKQMKNSPFQFNPENWPDFFKTHGWKDQEYRYLVEASEKLGRNFTLPFWAKLMRFAFSPSDKSDYKRFSAYVLLEPLP